MILHQQGKHYRVIGSEEDKTKFVEGKVKEWAKAVKLLARVATKYPQTAYAGFCFCLQNEWQYLQRVVSDTGPFFAPVEEAIRQDFILALLGMPAEELSGEFRELLTQSVKKGGLGIRNPVDTAMHVHDMYLHAGQLLVDRLVRGRILVIEDHNQTVVEACADGRKRRLER